MRDVTKLLVVGMIAATLPVMAATGMFGGGPDDGRSRYDGDGYIGVNQGECWDNGDGSGGCEVVGGGGSGGPGGSGGGGGGGGACAGGRYNIDGTLNGCGGGGTPPPPPPPPECRTDAQTRQEAEDFLMANSPTARDLINTIRNQGTQIEVMDSRVTENSGSYNHIENVIRWDPFLMFDGVNANGSPYTISPIMALAHEIAHASERNNPLGYSESYAMLTANQIARELNSALNRSYDDSRNEHQADRSYFVSSPYANVPAQDYRSDRPQCFQ